MHRRRDRQHEAEQPRPVDADRNAGFRKVQAPDCIVLPQHLHRNPVHRIRCCAGDSCDQQLVWWLTLALDAAAQGCTTKGGVDIFIFIFITVLLCILTPLLHLPHRLHIHHEAEAVQPCQLRQLTTCDHHLPRPSSVI